MIRLGEYQTLKIVREKSQGYYLEDEEGNEVLFPRNYITEDMSIGDAIKVFVYTDTEDVIVATTEDPYLTVGQFAYLQVTDVNRYGAFCEWGVLKELFIPYSNQVTKIKVGSWYVVHMYIDEMSNRLVGTTRLKKHLIHQEDGTFKKGQKVDALVYNLTPLGYKVIINQRYSGLVYDSEVPEPLRYGEEIIGYIKAARDDGKIDVSIFPIGIESIGPNARMILERLEENDGHLPFNDKRSPEDIFDEFNISKKLFKKSIGALYKQKRISINDDGIRLIAND